MKRILSALLLVFCSAANAQFVTGQILTAAQLNAAFANVLALTGGTLTGPLTVPTMTVTGTLNAPNISISGGTISGAMINGSAIGAITPSTGAFTSLSATTPIAIASGGTGQVSQSAALTALLGSSTVPVANGGTAATTAAAARTNLGAAASGANTDITSLSGPALGAATATTAAVGTNTTQVATTAFAQNAVTGGGNAGSFTTLKASSLVKILAQNTSGQSIPSTTATVITNWSTTCTGCFDANSNFNASTGTFTAPATAYYSVSCQLVFNGAMTSGAILQNQIVANGTAFPIGFTQAPNGANTNNAVATSGIVSLAAGQTVQIKALQSNATAFPLATTATITYLSIAQIP